MLLAVSALMVFVSAVLPPGPDRWANGVLGVVYAIVQALTFPGSPLFYQIVVVFEVTLCALIVWYAFRWPARAALAA